MSEELNAGSSAASNVRPMVGSAVSSRGLWVFGVAAAVGAAALFVGLEDRRAGRSTSALTAPTADDGSAMIAAAPALDIPAEVSVPAYAPINAGQGPASVGQAFVPGPAPNVTSNAVRPSSRGTVSRIAEPVPFSVSTASAAPANAAPTEVSRGAEVVYDGSRASAPLPAKEADGAKGSERVQASHFANPATTVPKGTVMQAVLESALDSTRPGLARAIISRDVSGFDGSHVLIARGSRLIGEYKADLSLGQKRVSIQWQRLVRPDGVIINLDSPSADPLGRAGIKGKVNGHFFDRFGGAILQSALDVGVQVAANKIAGGSTVYALPGLYALPGVGQNGTRAGQQNVQPTVTVKQGTSVSVFVARDLDFTNVE